jgi:hypothetical protein
MQIKKGENTVNSIKQQPPPPQQAQTKQTFGDPTDKRPVGQSNNNK